MSVLRIKGQQPNAVLSRYISWFQSRRRFGSIHDVVIRRGEATSNRSSQETGGNERFDFGKHRGQTFQQVAREDPSYHRRCQATGYGRDSAVMQRYTAYFDRYGDEFAAARGEREAIGYALGMLPECYGQYDD